jgi:hypothetical protein
MLSSPSPTSLSIPSNSSKASNYSGASSSSTVGSRAAWARVVVAPILFRIDTSPGTFERGGALDLNLLFDLHLDLLFHLFLIKPYVTSGSVEVDVHLSSSALLYSEIWLLPCYFVVGEIHDQIFLLWLSKCPNLGSAVARTWTVESICKAQNIVWLPCLANVSSQETGTVQCGREETEAGQDVDDGLFMT